MWHRFLILKETPVLRVVWGRRPLAHSCGSRDCHVRSRPRTATDPGPRHASQEPAPAARREEAEALRGARRGEGAVSHWAAATTRWDTHRSSCGLRVSDERASRAEAPGSRVPAGGEQHAARRAPRGAGPLSVYLLPGHRGLAPSRWTEPGPPSQPTIAFVRAAAVPCWPRRPGWAISPRATAAKVANARNPGSARGRLALGDREERRRAPGQSRPGGRCSACTVLTLEWADSAVRES